jgi:hypothetical protein
MRSVACATACNPDAPPTQTVVLTPRRLWRMAVCPAAALMTVLEKSIGLA